MSHIQTGAVIYAKDFIRIAEFYKNVVELEIRATDTTHVRLESESFQLVVLQVPKRIAQTIKISEPPLRREDTPIKLDFFVQSINKTRNIVNELGGELNGAEKEWAFGEYKVCDGHDPEGNIFQIRAPSRLQI